ncbi:hypothetical protein FQA47_020042 [Oryzias melastigma]|uniref:Uncharacterized protein n=1 Tax=Oryzias melastigma TaxID=30732 RepID=A0A834FGU3_ORYME|nr:hypothetical protein FQA47_020042 [Oryzias melastigma]
MKLLGMCRKTMETTSKLIKTDFLQQTSKHECKCFSLYTKDNEVFKLQRPLTKSAIRKQRRRDLKRAELAKLAGYFLIKEDNQKTGKRNRLAVCLPDGAMAPANTTQYLMSKDLEALPDSDFEDCLEFQQRHFDEIFDLA